jgi:hypothetical protein
MNSIQEGFSRRTEVLFRRKFPRSIKCFHFSTFFNDKNKFTRLWGILHEGGNTNAPPLSSFFLLLLHLPQNEGVKFSSCTLGIRFFSIFECTSDGICDRNAKLSYRQIKFPYTRNIHLYQKFLPTFLWSIKTFQKNHFYFEGYFEGKRSLVFIIFMEFNCVVKSLNCVDTIVFTCALDALDEPLVSFVLKSSYPTTDAITTTAITATIVVVDIPF